MEILDVSDSSGLDQTANSVGDASEPLTYVLVTQVKKAFENIVLTREMYFKVTLISAGTNPELLFSDSTLIRFIFSNAISPHLR